MLIYNRDSEQPIPMDLDISWEILKSIEDCQGVVEVLTKLLSVCVYLQQLILVSQNTRRLIWSIGFEVVLVSPQTACRARTALHHKLPVGPVSRRTIA